MRRFIGFFSGSAAFAGVQLTVSILVARLLGPEAFAHFVVALAVSTPIALFCNFGSRQLLASDQELRLDPRSVLGVMRYLAVVGFIFSIVCLLFFPAYFSGWGVLFLVVFAYKLQEGKLELFIGALQREERFAEISRTQITKAASYLVAFVVGLVIFESLIASMLLALLGISAIAARRGQADRLQSSLHSSLISQRGILLLGLPLALTALLTALSNNLPRVVYDLVAEVDEFSRFAAAVQLIALPALLLTVAGQYALPRMSRLRFNKDGAFEILVLRLSLVSLVMGIACAAIFYFLGDSLIDFIFDLNENPESKLMPAVGLYAIGICLLSISNYVVVAQGLLRVQSGIAALSVAAFLLLSLAAYGLSMSPNAMLAGFGVLLCIQATLLTWLSLRDHSIRTPCSGAYGCG